jgi:hypothetical protein
MESGFAQETFGFLHPNRKFWSFYRGGDNNGQKSLLGLEKTLGDQPNSDTGRSPIF